MSKIKVHELAKKLNKQSKEVMDIANRIGIEVKSHMNLIDEEQVAKIEKEINGSNIAKTEKKEKNEKQTKATQKQEETKKEKANSTPVIIRREVIISDEEIAKREKQKQSKQEVNRKDIGFVERKRNQEYNIVYRNKPNKPMTASELFGIPSKAKKEELKKEEKPSNNEAQQKLEEIKGPKQETRPIENRNKPVNNFNRDTQHERKSSKFWK